MALFRRVLRPSAPSWKRQLVTGGSVDWRSVAATCLSLGLQTSMLSPGKIIFITTVR